MLGAGVATSYKGKSSIPETHAQALGMVGQYGQQAANTAVGRADVVLVVGAKLTSQETVGETPSLFDPKRQTIIQIDIEERNAGWSFPIDLGLIGDGKEVLLQIIDALGVDGRDNSERVGALASLKKNALFYKDPELFMDSSPVMPQRLVRLLQETLDPSTLISLDAGNNRVWMCHHYQSQAAKTIICSRRYGRNGVEPSRSASAQAGVSGETGCRGHGRRGLYDVRPRHFNCHTI